MITHDHYDHFSVEDIGKVAGGNMTLIVPEKMERKAQEVSGLVSRIVTVRPGESYEVVGTAGKPEDKSGDKSEVKSEKKSEGRPEDKSGDKSEDKSEKKPEGRPEEKSGDKSEDKSEKKSEEKLENKLENKPEHRLEFETVPAYNVLKPSEAHIPWMQSRLRSL